VRGLLQSGSYEVTTCPTSGALQVAPPTGRQVNAKARGRSQQESDHPEEQQGLSSQSQQFPFLLIEQIMWLSARRFW
jgi:hypothetical protein